MKGVIFNLLENFICDTAGDEVYENILSLCPLKTKEPFIGPGTYPDTDLMAIATKAAAMLDLELNEALKAFGHYAFPKLAQRYPSFLNNVNSARDFLLTVNSVIHVEVKKLYPQAEPPEFHYEDLSDEQLVMSYSSKRQLCPLVEGFISGVADYFNSTISISHPRCVHRGDAACDFDLRFNTP